MENVICPICETSNAPTLTHCEVCDEALIPIAAAALAQEGAPSFDLNENDDFEPGTEEIDSISEVLVEEDSDATVHGQYPPKEDATVHIQYSPDGSILEEQPEFEVPEHIADAMLAAESSVVAGLDENEEDRLEEPRDTQPSDEAEASDAMTSETGYSNVSYSEASHSVEGSPQFREIFKLKPKTKKVVSALPHPGVYTNPATLVVYANREAAFKHYIEMDEMLLGRHDTTSESSPDFDLSEFDPNARPSRKHAYIYRQNKNYTLCVVSTAGTQLNNEMLYLGDQRTLNSGDVIVLAGELAIEFALDPT